MSKFLYKLLSAMKNLHFNRKYVIALSASFLIIVSLIGLNVELKKATKKSKFLKSNQSSIYKNGDIIFQTTIRGQGKAIQLATESIYTHVGFMLQEGQEWYVYEAVQPVRRSKLKDFIGQGDSSKYVVKRVNLSDSIFNEKNLETVKLFLNQQLNKPYDLVFNWSDNEMYCSELVWKAYHAIGLSLCDLKLLKDYNLSHPIVKSVMNQRYGKNIPYNDSMVAPCDLFKSSNLLEIENTY